jgi:hypothetical protein
MSTPDFDRIDFISAYCDRWCEQCAFTTRCSEYAVEAALEMCEGDLAAAIDLAVGLPASPSGPTQNRRAALPDEFIAVEPTPHELEAMRREEDARTDRIDEEALITACERMHLLARDWLGRHREAASTHSRRLADAVAVIGWDAGIIHAKLRRALRGRDEYLHGRPFEKDPVQNDWNGSAKVALISIRRSAAAWTAAAEELNDDAARAMAAELRTVEREALRAFPDAWRFKRPGFDDPAASVAAGG